MSIFLVLDEIHRERIRQNEKFGPQVHLPNGTGQPGSEADRDLMQARCDDDFERDESEWYTILLEEVYEAGVETEYLPLRTELIQVAAVAVKWVEALDREHR